MLIAPDYFTYNVRFFFSLQTFISAAESTVEGRLRAHTFLTSSIDQISNFEADFFPHFTGMVEKLWQYPTVGCAWMLIFEEPFLFLETYNLFTFYDGLNIKAPGSIF